MVREQALSLPALHLEAVTVFQSEFERGQGDQLARREEIEVDPSEEKELLASLEFGGDDLGHDPA